MKDFFATEEHRKTQKLNLKTSQLIKSGFAFVRVFLCSSVAKMNLISCLLWQNGVY
jgi:hypothetical protein